jgi:signal transduction histidine kinase
MAWQTEKKLTLAAGMIAVFLLLNAIASYQTTRTVIETNTRVAYSHEALAELEAIVSIVKDAEAGERAYLISGEEIDLLPYRAALVSIDQHFTRLRRLTADNPVQQRWIERLDSLITRSLRIMNTGVSLRRERGFDAARRWIASGGSREAMADIRTHIDQMVSEERSLLQRRAQASAQSEWKVRTGLVIETLLSLTLVFIVFYVIRRDLRARERATQTLQAAHEELEQRIQARTQELERSNRELQDFASIASHDLQEPLRKIQAFGDRLKAKHGAVLPEEARDHLERMLNAARRMHSLINDLLMLSRVMTKAQPFVPVALEELASEVIGDLETRIEETDGCVELINLPTIEADPLQMRQLLQNLIGNALKFHRREHPPRVQVRGTVMESGENADAGRFCEIAVQDNGIGIDEQYWDKLFTPFQRLHGRGEYEGTGIGLAVCRKIVERHGGSITVTSTPGEGSTFLVTLPLTHNSEGARAI